MSLRLFAALPVPEEIAGRLTALQKSVPGAKWRSAEIMHITLAFFGEVDDPAAEALDIELAGISCKPFDLAIKGAGHFGRAAPRVLWMGVVPHPSLLLLATSCERAARRVGIPMEKRKFSPHVTMAYLGETRLDRVLSFERRLALYRSKDWRADRFYLISSWSGGRGDNPYRIEAEYPLI